MEVRRACTASAGKCCGTSTSLFDATSNGRHAPPRAILFSRMQRGAGFPSPRHMPLVPGHAHYVCRRACVLVPNAKRVNAHHAAVFLTLMLPTRGRRFSIAGRLPPQLDRLTYLEELSLPGNKLFGEWRVAPCALFRPREWSLPR